MKKRTLRLESLESRELMAGDVTVRAQGAILRISGDVFDNAVAVTRANGRIVVAGIPDANDLITTINGRAVDVNNFSTQTFSNIKIIEVNLKAGDDTFGMTGVGLNGLSVSMGAGDDNVLIGSTPANLPPGIDLTRVPDDIFNFAQGRVSLKGVVNISTGGDDDLVTLAGVNHTGALSINTGSGFDAVGLDTSANGRVDVTGTLKIQTGDDDDQVFLNSVRATLIDVALGDGDDALAVGNTRATVAFFAGNGDDLFGDVFTSLGGNSFRVQRRSGF